MKFAVIEAGAHQLLVAAGDKIKIDKISGEPGKTVKFNKVLLVADGDKVSVGKPFVEGFLVEGKIVKHGRDKKILVMKYHNKTRYRRKKGHRQDFSEVEITKI